MHKYLKTIMLILGTITGIYLFFMMLSALSWKIYRIIYKNYTLGALFPFANHTTIFVFLIIISCIIALAAARIIIKIIKSFK